MRKRLKQIRENNNYTVKEVAKNLKISEDYYYKIEAKTRNPSIKIAKKAEIFFKIPMEELFCDLFEEDVKDIK